MNDIDINSLKVAQPCSMGWANMSGNDRVRLCHKCERSVYNIAEMTTLEVQSLMQNKQGRICGRLFKRADGTVITQDCPVGLNKYRKRLAKYYSAVLGAVIALASVGYAQKEVKGEKNGKADIESVSRPRGNKLATIKGTIFDSLGAVVPGAKITIEVKGQKDLVVETGDEGEYTISFPARDKFTLNVKAGGFKAYERKNISFKEDKDLRMDITLEIYGDIVVVGDLLL